MTKRQQPEQQAPPVQRLRVRYAKRGRLRFTSHRDFARAFERALQRARVPMAYSSGFNPHPRISYAGAAPTGAASEAEYLEIALVEQADPGEVQQRLSAALPDGLDVLAVVAASGTALPDRLQASHWQVRSPAPEESVRHAVEQFLAQESVTVGRTTKKGRREVDCRGDVVSVRVSPDESGVCCDIVLRHGEPTVRCEDVLRGIAACAPVDWGRAPVTTRVAQGPLRTGGGVGDPFGED